MKKKYKEYTCTDCGYTTNRKSNYLNHIGRKVSCTLAQKNESFTQKNEGFYSPSKNEGIHSKNEGTSKNEEIHSKNEVLKTICEFCKKKFNRNDNLKRHMKKCKNRKEYELQEQLRDLKMKLENERLEKEKYKDKFEEENKSVRNLISTNKMLVKQSNDLKATIEINMNMNNYFVLNQYGKENTKYIDYGKILNDYYSLGEMVAKEIQLKHFSKHKENQNIIIDRNYYRIYNNKGVWESKEDNVKLFIKSLIKKGVINIDDYKKTENIIFDSVDKEKTYKKDKRSLLRNLPLPCIFNPIEAKKRLEQIQEQKEKDTDPEFIDHWNRIEKKYKKELKTSKKQLDAKKALVENLEEAIKNKEIKASAVKFKNY